MPPVRALFLLALVPPEPVLSEIWALKQHVHALTGSRNAVRLLPHITLWPPQPWTPTQAHQVEAALAAFVTGEQAPHIQLQGFDWFADRTVFVCVLSPELREFQIRLPPNPVNLRAETETEIREFMPHITLATRDLTSQHAALVRLWLTEITNATDFCPDRLTLFEHDTKQWQVRREFSLANPAVGPSGRPKASGE